MGEVIPIGAADSVRRGYRYAVYEHRLVTTDGLAYTRSFIVLKNRYGVIVRFTKLHRFTGAHNGKIYRQQASDVKQRLYYICMMLNYVLIDHYDIYGVDHVFKVTKDMLTAFFMDYAHEKKVNGKYRGPDSEVTKMIRRLICFLATMIVLLTAAQVPVFAGSEASAAGTIVSRDEYETPLMKDGAQSIQDAAVTGIEDKTYTGEALTQSPVVVLNKVTLKEGTDYELTYGNNINAGTATVTINGIGRYQSSISRTFTINKAVNPMTVKAKKLTAKSSGKTTFKKKEAFTVKNAQGKVTYKKVKGNSKIRVYKSGKVIVKKGLETGRTYSVKVKVTAAGNTNYKEKSKKVTLKIKID